MGRNPVVSSGYEAIGGSSGYIAMSNQKSKRTYQKRAGTQVISQKNKLYFDVERSPFKGKYYLKYNGPGFTTGVTVTRYRLLKYFKRA